ncbi:MAG: hypothetical protein WBB19_13095, partial [Desulforhopalus sp.]
MALQKQISDLLDELIIDAKELISDSHNAYGTQDMYIQNTEKLLKWSNELILFKSLCSEIISPWEPQLKHNGVSTAIDTLERPLSVLKTIRGAVDKGLLSTYEDLIFAEAFADLYEQGQHLFSQGYYLAAGVIYRAVLEEHLRHLCDRNSCNPAKQKPAINDLNMALYKHNPPVYDKSVML